MPETIDKNKLPRHVAIIMDGNGRWAKKRFLPRTAGHKVGLDTFVDTVDLCADMGIEVLTVYAFSSENWNREQQEVTALMELLSFGIARYVPDLMKKNIKLYLIGDIERFAPQYRKALYESRANLAGNTGLKLCICLSYGGRQEILHAVNSLIADGVTNVTAEDLESRLYTAGIPYPDLVIRTGGEYRISNFLLWQSAYSEYYFSEVFWPDFDKKELQAALDSYAKRERRFGK